MAHKNLVGGTAYETKGGTCLVGGTAYSIKKGRTLIGGTGYDISFAPEIITFTWYTGYNSDGSTTTHQAEEGMTWGEYCESDYNTLGFQISSNNSRVLTNTGAYITIKVDGSTVSGPDVYSYDAIIAGTTYARRDWNTAMPGPS